MNILRVSTFLLIMMMLVPIDASAHCDGKHTGSHPHCVGGDPGGEDPTADPALAFTTGSDDGIKLIDVDGSNVNQIFSKKVERGQWVWSLHWSPDGSQLAFLERKLEDGSFIIVNPDGSNPVFNQPNFEGVDLSPQRLFEWRNVDPTGPTVNGSPTRFFFLAAPIGSTSGHSAYWDIYTMEPGSGPVQNAHRLTALDTHRLTPSGTVARITDITVSPDGMRIAAVYHFDYGNKDPYLLLYKLGVNDGELMITETSNITPSTFPSVAFSPYNMRWANTSDTILYQDENDMFALDVVNGSHVTQLEGGGIDLDIGCIRSPVWSPDDSKVAFDIQCWNKSQEGIRVADVGIDATTGELALTNIVQITTGIDNLAVIDWLPTP
jgi:WD40 repeat protein